MTEQEREELIEKMAKAAWECDILRKWEDISKWMQDWVRWGCRAALAVAEPVIREECAKICDRRYMGDNNREDMEARRCAAAIREGGKDEN